MSYIITLICVLSNDSIGFPYNEDPTSPKQKRLVILKTEREFIDSYAQKESIENTISAKDSGFYIIRWDYPWTKNILGNELAFTNPKNLRDITETDCAKWLGCGVPIHRFKLKGALKNKWLNSGIFQGDLPMDEKVELHVQSVERILSEDQNMLHNVTITVQGPSRMTLVLSPSNRDTSFEMWGFEDVHLQIPFEAVYENERPYQFIQFIQGVNPRPHSFWVIMKNIDNPKIENGGAGFIEASLTGHYDHGKGVENPSAKFFVNRLPKWITASAWTAQYKNYKIYLNDTSID